MRKGILKVVSFVLGGVLVLGSISTKSEAISPGFSTGLGIGVGAATVLLMGGGVGFMCNRFADNKKEDASFKNKGDENKEFKPINRHNDPENGLYRNGPRRGVDDDFMCPHFSPVEHISLNLSYWQGWGGEQGKKAFKAALNIYYLMTCGKRYDDLSLQEKSCKADDEEIAKVLYRVQETPAEKLTPAIRAELDIIKKTPGTPIE